MPRKKQGKKTPSRLRYEQANPTVSFRLPREIRARLESQMEAPGLSPAQWVQQHLDQDDARANMRAEILARERGGLGRDIDEKRQELARLDHLIGERDKKLLASVEVRRTEMLKEVDLERNRRLKAVEYDVSLERTSLNSELSRWQQENEAKEAEARRLGEVVAARQAELSKLGQALSNRQRLLEELVKQALEIARSQGAPAVYCLSCPGYKVVRSALDILPALAAKGPLPEKGPADEGGGHGAV